MKIILAVNGEGYGHATRCHALLQQIYPKHEIMILAGSKSYDYLSKHYNVTRISSLHNAYYNNKVSNLKTLFINFIRIPDHIKTFITIVKLIRKFKPDVVINDFEFFTNYVSLIMRVPLVSIDNEQIITCTKIDIPPESRLNYLKVATIIKFISPNAQHRIIPTFFYPYIIKKNVTLVSPLIRKEITKLKTKRDGRILVYQTTDTNKKLIDIIKSLPYKFVVYGFDFDETEGNIIHKKFDPKLFFKDLSNCNAVILNGGFSLMTEALALGKPILALPIKGQFEQLINAHYLQKLKYGEYGETNRETIESFLKRSSKYVRENQIKINEIKKIEEVISRVS